MRNNSSKSKLPKFIIILFMVFALFSCETNQTSTHQKKTSSDVLPKAYVIGITEGNILSNSPISINFSIDIELINNLGNVIDDNIFSFTPPIKGKVYMNGNSSLSFKPDEALKNGKTYNGVIDLSKLFKIAKGQDKFFRFEINAIPMQITIKMDQLRPYDGKDSKFSSLDGKIISSDIIDNKNLANIITAEQDGEKLNIIFSELDVPDVYNFRVENIERKKSKSTVVISWNGKTIGSLDAGRIDIDVPSLATFELTNIKVVNTPAQYVEITFSDPIDKEINLEGIVFLTENQKTKYDIESNKIFIYTNTLQKGDAVLAIKKELRSSKGLNLDK